MAMEQKVGSESNDDDDDAGDSGGGETPQQASEDPPAPPAPPAPPSVLDQVKNIFSDPLSNFSVPDNPVESTDHGGPSVDLTTQGPAGIGSNGARDLGLSTGLGSGGSTFNNPVIRQVPIINTPLSQSTPQSVTAINSNPLVAPGTKPPGSIIAAPTNPKLGAATGGAGITSSNGTNSGVPGLVISPAMPVDPATTAAQAAAQSAAENASLAGLNSDMAAGQAYTTASGAFAPGAMGRVNATTDATTADALAKAQALEGGLTAPQMEAQKELNDQAIGGQEQSNMMQLRGIQGAQGLHGASAAAQQIGVLNTAGAQQQTAARQEQLDQLAAQQTGVQNFLQDNQSNNAFNTANTQYNNQQENAEAAGRLSTPMTYAGLLQGVRTGADANTIAQEGANNAATAAANAGNIALAQLQQDKVDEDDSQIANGGGT